MQARAENFAPYSMAAGLHLLIALSLVVSFSFSSRDRIETPLAITAVVIAEETRLPTPAPVEEPEVVEQPIPEPTPDPVVDTAEQDRIAAEAAKREEDARIERERQAELDRQAEVARQERLAREKAEREAETERRRVEAERIRQEEIERQRAENERLRREAEAADRQAELDAEMARNEARTADATAAYEYRIRQHISRYWVQPAQLPAGIECVLNIRQLPGGEVVSVSMGRCNGDDVLKRSLLAAVDRASPLPMPVNPDVFDRQVILTFRPDEEN
ncbi:MAG: TonB C-terminal domain-containing protein [Pseudomonadota bacterium]